MIFVKYFTTAFFPKYCQKVTQFKSLKPATTSPVFTIPGFIENTNFSDILQTFLRSSCFTPTLPTQPPQLSSKAPNTDDAMLPFADILPYSIPGSHSLPANLLLCEAREKKGLASSELSRENSFNHSKSSISSCSAMHCNVSSNQFGQSADTSGLVYTQAGIYRR